MRNGRIRTIGIAMGLSALPFLIVPPAFALESTVDQKNAQHLNAFTNAKGSDDSIDEATRNAMKAFMNLAALNIPGAISKGYQAYGNYLNSEKMDDLEARSKVNRNIMSSIGSGMGPGGGATGILGDKVVNSDVTGNKKIYSQMDMSFLHKGETAEVAAEFEKKSGMKREDFFKHMAAGLDSRPTWDDPQLMQKLEGHFNNFKNAVPNKEFRDGLETAQNTIPSFARNKIMGEIAEFYSDAMKGWNKFKGGDSAVADSGAGAPPAEANREIAALAAPVPVTAEAANSAVSAPSAAAADGMAVSPAVLAAASAKGLRKVARPDDGMFIGIRTDSKDALGDILNGPPVVSGEHESIFKTISKRYRILTPALLGKASVLDSK